MLSHYKKRAEECASRLLNAKSDKLRIDYQRLLDSWSALIKAEEERLAKRGGNSQSQNGEVIQSS